MDKLFTKLGIAFSSSLVICESVNLQPLWNALITLGVSVITVLSVEGISWLRAFLKRKKTEEENKEKNEVK